MNKIIKLGICVFILSILSACATTPPAEEVMPPVKYTAPISFYIPKNAYLNWEVGKQYVGTVETYISPQGGALGAVLATAIDTQQRKMNPGRYNFNYGKAQQVVFMTSLRDVLERNHVFKNVELTTEPQKLTDDNVLMTVNFRMTRVSTISEFKILLDAELRIKSQDKPEFKRNYFAESHDEGGFFTPYSFKQHQTNVSEKLMGNIIKGIHEWQAQSSKRKV